MPLAAKKTASPPSLWIWFAITFLWGTVFYATSIVMLHLSTSLLEQGFFNPAWEEIYSVYLIYCVALLIVALSAMFLKKRLDPQGEKQTRRQQEVIAGKREKVFVSLAGSFATSFFFTVLTAIVFSLSSGMMAMTVALTVPVVLLAAGLNISAGLGASLLVGLVIFVLKKV